MSNREPMSSGMPAIQAMPPVEKTLGRMASFRVTAGEEADAWRWLSNQPKPDKERPETWERFKFTLEPGDEQGNADKEAKYYMEMMDANNAFDFHDDADRDRFLRKVISDGTTVNWEESKRTAETKLREINQELTANDGDNMKDFGGYMNTFRGRQSAGMSAQADDKFAELIGEITAQKKLTREQRNSILKQLDELIREDIDIYIDLSRRPSKWSQLKPSTQSYLTRLSMADRRHDAEGAGKRVGNIRTRSDFRPNTPYGVLPEHEKEATSLLDQLEAHRLELIASQSPIDKRAIIETMEGKVNNLFEYLRYGTENARERHETGPTTREQTEVIAKDIFGVANRSRIPGTNDMWPTAVTFDAGWFKGSWETVGRMEDVAVAMAFAENVRHRLRYVPPAGSTLTGKQEFLDSFAKTPEIESPVEKKAREVREAEARVRKAIEAEELAVLNHEKAKRAKKKADVAVGAAWTKYTDMRTLVTGPAGGGGGGGGGRGDGNSKTAILKQESDDHGTAERAAEVAEEARIAAKAARRVAETERTNAEAALAAKVAEIIPPTAITAHTAQINADKEAQYDSILERLDEYMENPHAKDIYDLFDSSTEDDSEMRLLSKLSTINVSSMKNTPKPKRALRINPQVTATGTVTRKDGSVLELPWAVVNLWAGSSSPGRLSTEAIPQMLDDTTRFPELHKLQAPAALGVPKPNKGVLFYGFAANPDITGGVERSKSGPKLGKLAELEKKHEGNGHSALGEWLDNPHVQYEVGEARPEEIAQLACTDLVRDYLVRAKYFPASEGWGFMPIKVISGTNKNIETIISEIVVAGHDLTSESLREWPFNQPDQSNEPRVTIIDDSTGSTQMVELYRNRDLTKEANGAKTLVQLYARHCRNRLELYYRHGNIGAPSPIPNRRFDLNDDQVVELGGFMKAYVTYIEELMVKLDAIETDPAYAPDPTIPEDVQRLQAMLQFHQQDLAHLTYDILDENLLDANDQIKLNERAANKALRSNLQNIRTRHGRENSNMRKKLRQAYVKTFLNPNAPDATVDRGRQMFLDQFAVYSEDIIDKKMLGMQAAGMVPNAESKANRFIAERLVARNALQITWREYFQASKAKARERLGKNNDLPSRHPINIFGEHMEELVARTKGAMKIGGAADHGRRIKHILGLPVDSMSRLLNEDYRIELQNEKNHGAMMLYIAAHVADLTKTPNGYGWFNGGILEPDSLDTDYKEGYNMEGLQPAESTLDLVRRFDVGAAEKEGADGADRLGNAENLDVAVSSRKYMGVNYKVIREAVFDSVLRDSQWVDPSGQFRLDNRPFGHDPYDVDFGDPLASGRTRLRHLLGRMLVHTERFETDKNWAMRTGQAVNRPVRFNTTPAVDDL